MTISTQTSRMQYAGNGVTTSFPVPFEFLTATPPKVIYTVAGIDTAWVAGTNYTVTGGGAQQPATGAVVPTIVAPLGSVITILRNEPFTQAADYIPNDPFPAVAHEKALDRLSMQNQMLSERVGRALTLKESSTSSDIHVADPVAGKILGWNSAGTGIENKEPVDVGAAGVAGAAIFAASTGAEVRTYIDAQQHSVNLDALALSAADGRNYLDTIVYVADKTALAALNVTKDVVAYFDGYEWEQVTLVSVSGAVTADTAQGIYVQSSNNVNFVWRRRFRGEWYASWFGILPTATASANVTAFNAMLNLADLQDTSIFFEDGRYPLNAKITKTLANKLALIFSTGRSAVLEWSNASGGLDLTFSNAFKPPVLWCPQLETSAADGGTALKITSPVVASLAKIGPWIQDPSCRGVDTSVDYWTKGIHLKNCWYTSIEKPDIKGKDEAVLPFSMDTGIEAEDCQVTRIRDCVMLHMTKGYETTGSTHGEGLNISGGEMVGVYTGVDHTRASATSGSVIHDIHINAYFRCIVLNNIAQMNVHDCLLYKTHVSAEDWQGVELNNSLNCQVHSNEIATPGVSAGTHFGVTTVNTHDCKIYNNKFAYWPSGSGGILMGAGSSKLEVFGNSKPLADTFPTSIVQISGASADNKIWNNYPLPNQVFTAADTTPSVGNAQHELFLTANASSTTITRLDDMYQGQIVRILINDVNTGFTHNGASFILKGNVNIAVGTGAGGFIWFTKTFDNLIREIGRSF